MIFGKPIKDVTATDIENLVDNRVREDRHLDYKQELPGRKESDKKRFLADVSALANSTGGDIIFGIEEQRDSSGAPTGEPKGIIGLQVANADQEILRLTNIIDNGLDPAILPKTEALPVDTKDGVVLILRVPKSFTAPHMIRSSGWFYARHTSHNVPMDTATLRASFTSSTDWSERTERFRLHRLAKLMADELPVPAHGPERLVLHLVPFSAFTPDAGVDVRGFKKVSVRPIISEYLGSVCRFNLEGLCVHDTTTPCSSYSQFFRAGALEAVVYEGNPGRDRRFVRLHFIEDHTAKALTLYAKLLLQQGAALPMAVLLSFLGAKGCEAIRGCNSSDRLEIITRNDIILPSVILADLTTDPEVLMRDVFDALWQACGYERSLSYSESGEWVRKDRPGLR